MNYKITILVLLFIVASTLNAQTEEEAKVEDISEETNPVDDGLNNLFNGNKSPIQALENGGAFYISNPTPLIELDPKLAYFKTEWEPLVVRLVTGRTAELTGRYRLLDQKFEIQTDDGIFEIYSTMLAEAQLGDDYFLVQSNFGDPKIYQVYFRGEDYMLLGEHTAELQEPQTQNMFDTSEAKQTLKRKRKMYIRYPDGVKVELKNKKQIMTALRVFKGSNEAGFVKKEKLDLKEPTDLARLLNYMAESKG